MYVWLIICGIAFLVEWLTPSSLVSVWFGLAAGIVAFIPISFGWQMVLFLILSLGFVLLVRPFIKKYIHIHVEPTNADRIIGQVGIVTREITSENWGEVYVQSSYWSATGSPVKKGNKVRILAIEGAKVVVEEIKE